MEKLIDDQLVNYTRNRVSDKGVLTYSFAKGDLSPFFRSKVKEIISEIDNRLDEISFRKIKRSGKTDILIGHGELPDGAAGAAVWNDVRWEIRLPESYFSTTIMRHEMGHVLGLGHVPMGTNSLMQPSWGGIGDFTKKDWNALESIWE